MFPDLSPPPLQPCTSPPGWRLKRQEVPLHPSHPISTGQNPSCAPNPGLPAPSCPLAPSPHPSAASRTLPSLLATPLRLAPGLCPLPGTLCKILCWTIARPTSPRSAPGYSRCCSSGRSCSASHLPTPPSASSLATEHYHRAVTRRAQTKPEPPGTQACVAWGIDPIPHPFPQAVLGFVATPFLFLGVSGCLLCTELS